MSLFDMKFVARRLLRAPGFAVTAILVLALGVGATTAIFSVVDGILLQPLPFPKSDQIVVLTDRLTGVGTGSDEAGVTAADIPVYASQVNSFESLGAYRQTPSELSEAGTPSQIYIARLNAGVFATLGVSPVIGRTFTKSEEEQKQQVAVLSYRTWQNRFHGDTRILGSKVSLDRKPYLVIGVMPSQFDFPLLAGRLKRTELWVPLSLTPDQIAQGASSWDYQMVGRLKPGVTVAQAQADAERAAQQIMRGYPPFMASLHINAVVRTLYEETINRARPLVRTLFLAVAVVLLIACANLAGLLLVRAIRNRSEAAVRQALGASPAVLIRQQLMESMVLSLIGGGVGILIALWAVRVGANFLPDSLPRLENVSLNWTVTLFAIALSVITGVLCGIAPAFAISKTNLNETLKEGGRSGSAGAAHARLRSALVVAEIAIAMMLLTASGLLLRSFQKMSSVDLGFRPEFVTAASYSLPKLQYSSQLSIDSFSEELLRRTRQIPGVETAGLASLLPSSDDAASNAFVPEGYNAPKGAGMNLSTSSIVDGDYFNSMQIPLIKGRYFTSSDGRDSQLVAIVNRRLAEHYWPNQDPIGKRIRLGTEQTPTPWMTVVGEIGDVKLGSPDSETKEQIYQLREQFSRSLGSLTSPGDRFGDSAFIVIRSSLPPEQIENSLRKAVHAIDPLLPLTQVQSMVEAMSHTEAPRRFNTTLISSFALAALVLAVLGMYSVLAFSVAARDQEIAIRMALGSKRHEIVRMVLVSGLKLALVGCCLGLAGSVVSSRLLSSLLFNVTPFDPMVLATSVLLVVGLALGAALLPAIRASTINPVRALRAQ